MKPYWLKTAVAMTIAAILIACSINDDADKLMTEDFYLSVKTTLSDDNWEKKVDLPYSLATAGLLKEVRSANSRFNATKQAIMAGYEPDDHCVSVPGIGGMGYHWLNPGLVDDVFDPLQPEVVLYETGQGGNLRLVAVEYIVIDTGQDLPVFGDQPFDVGGTPLQVSHWSLHVWLYKDNPSGIFIPFNPDVSCP